MATYIANSASREVVTVMLSKAEADALRDLAVHAYEEREEPLTMNSSTKAAACRAMDALSASTDTRARRAGFFET
jgi:hypothetical protein